MISIDELRKKHQTEKEKHEYSSKLLKIRHGWITTVFGFAALTVTIAILFLDRLLKLNKDIWVNIPESLNNNLKIEIPLDLRLEIAGAILLIALVFIALNWFSNNNLVKILAKQHADLVTVMEIFEAVKENVDKNNSELSKFITQSKTISKNLKSAPVSSLISWGDSGNIEILSKKVWSVSYSLFWLNKYRVNEILNELHHNKDHEYRYIIIPDDNLPKGEKDITVVKINNWIIDFDRINKTNLKDRFIIKKAKDKLFFPLPNDISIYQSFINDDETSSIVVINTHEFCDNRHTHEIKKEDLDKNFDLRFKEPIQVNRLVKWYDNFWKESKNFIND